MAWRGPQRSEDTGPFPALEAGKCLRRHQRGGAAPRYRWMRTRHPKAAGAAGVVGTPARSGARSAGLQEQASEVARHAARRPPSAGRAPMSIAI